MNQLNFILPNVEACHNLQVQINGKPYMLKRHTKETLQGSRLKNCAMKYMSEEELDSIRFYVDLKEEDLPKNRLSRITVTSTDQQFQLPILHYQAYYIPRKHRKIYYENKLRKCGSIMSSKLESIMKNNNLKENMACQGNFLETLLDADNVLTPVDIAKSIIFQHPNLANNQPYTACIVMYDHIAPSREVNPEQYSRMMEFAEEIRKQGPDGWAKRTISMNQKTGKPLTYEYDVLGHKAGENVEIYSLSDHTLESSKSALGHALNSASQDSNLQGTSWHMSHGLVPQEQDEAYNVKRTQNLNTSLQRTDSNGVKWTLNEDVHLCGLYTYKDTIKLSDNKFKMDVRNIHLRTLSSYVEFFDDQGKSLDGTGKYVRIVNAVGTALGIPIPISTTNLEFDFDKNASKAKVYFGSLGTSNWKWDYDGLGAVLTSVFQYGIPSFYLAADCLLASNKFFGECLDDAKLGFMIYKEFMNMANFTATSASPSEIAIGFLMEGAKIIGGLLLLPVMKKILAYIIATISAEAAANAVPIVGQVLQIAAAAGDAIQLAETTGEVLASPATMELSISRAMDLQVNISPDPKHGNIDDSGASKGAIWPVTADHWQLKCVYKGGTTKIVNGTFPNVNSDKMISNQLDDVPMGGSLKITFNVYSKNGWLCGKYESDWMDALPDTYESGVKTITGNITEVLVPLTVDVQYEYKQKITYDEQKQQYVWHAGDKPQETIEALDEAGKGNALCKLVQMTYNGKKKQLGYVWSASGQNLPSTDTRTAQIEYLVQNMSTLADDSLKECFKAGEIGFIAEPLIAYDKFGNGRDNFILDTRNNQCHLRKVNLNDGKEGFGLDGELLSYGKFNHNMLDAMVIHPDGYAIGVNYATSKMEVLEIPETGSFDSDAKVAQIVSGEGFIEGRMQGPIAVKVSPTGAVLVLESVNQRIQAFDTVGNPLPSFCGKKEFDAPADGIVNYLNKQKFSEKLQEAFDENNLSHAFFITKNFVETLNAKSITEELKQAFADQGIYLCVDTIIDEETGESKSTAEIEVVKEDEKWKLHDNGRGYTYNLRVQEDEILVTNDYSDAVVKVREEGREWLIEDKDHTMAYLAKVIGAQSNVVSVYQYISYMNLYNPVDTKKQTYLDFSIESKGYLYVLSYVDAGTKETDYYLDIYNPDGSFLVRTPDETLCVGTPQHVNAAKIDVDEFRTMHTLNFEKMTGKHGYTEPTISQWIPTTPLFSLEKEKNPEFKEGNLDLIKKDFMEHGITLSKDAFVKTVIEDGQYQVNDIEVNNDTTQDIAYDVIYCVNQFEVYKRTRKPNLTGKPYGIGEDYTVESGEVLTLKDGQTYEFGTLTLKEDAKIQVEGKAVLHVDTLVKEGDQTQLVSTQSGLMNQIIQKQLMKKEEVLQKLLANGANIPEGVINTKDYEGGFVISCNDERNTILPRYQVSLQNVDEVKALIGNADELVETQNLCNFMEEPEVWEKSSLMSRSELNYKEVAQLCKAMQYYIYGDSRKVESYRDIINHLYFPMKSNVFLAGDIYVSEESPLIIEGDRESVTSVVFNQVTMEKNAKQISYGMINITAERYISEAKDSNEACLLLSLGNPGCDGSDVKTEAGMGAQGENGRSGESDKDSCSIAAKNGQPGSTGNIGISGGNGANGTDGNPLVMTLADMDGYYDVYSAGGNGGKGGEGGKGGKGGKGGSSAGSNGNCGPSNAGNGGAGGTGGAGGNGGNGGNGGTINIKYIVSDLYHPKFNVLTTDQAKQRGYSYGVGGAGGKGGPGGDGGDPGDNTAGGQPGSKGPEGNPGAYGQPGKPGKPGQILISGMPKKTE